MDIRGVAHLGPESFPDGWLEISVIQSGLWIVSLVHSSCYFGSRSEYRGDCDKAKRMFQLVTESAD